MYKLSVMCSARNMVAQNAKYASREGKYLLPKGKKSICSGSRAVPCLVRFVCTTSGVVQRIAALNFGGRMSSSVVHTRHVYLCVSEQWASRVKRSSGPVISRSKLDPHHGIHCSLVVSRRETSQRQHSRPWKHCTF